MNVKLGIQMFIFPVTNMQFLKMLNDEEKLDVILMTTNIYALLDLPII